MNECLIILRKFRLDEMGRVGPVVPRSTADQEVCGSTKA